MSELITPRLSGPEGRSPQPQGMGLDDQVYNRLLRERIIFLGSVVEDANANAICAQLLLLAAEDPDRDICLYINSPGGSVSAGMAIYDTMQFVKNDVATVAMGLAASMGQFLLCAGAPGKRYALPHARIMMHQPSGGLGGTASDIRIQAEQMLYTKKKMAELIARAHRPDRSSRSSATPTATAGSPRRRPGSTAWSTRSSSSAGQVERLGRHRMSDPTHPVHPDDRAPRGERAQMSDLSPAELPLLPAPDRGADVVRLAGAPTPTPSSSRSASSSSARPIDDASPTTSWPSC